MYVCVYACICVQAHAGSAMGRSRHFVGLLWWWRVPCVSRNATSSSHCNGVRPAGHSRQNARRCTRVFPACLPSLGPASSLFALLVPRPHAARCNHAVSSSAWAPRAALARAGGWLPRGDNTAIAHARSRAHAHTQTRAHIRIYASRIHELHLRTLRAGRIIVMIRFSVVLVTRRREMFWFWIMRAVL